MPLFCHTWLLVLEMPASQAVTKSLELLCFVSGCISGISKCAHCWGPIGFVSFYLTAQNGLLRTVQNGFRHLPGSSFQSLQSWWLLPQQGLGLSGPELTPSCFLEILRRCSFLSFFFCSLHCTRRALWPHPPEVWHLFSLWCGGGLLLGQAWFDSPQKIRK